MKMEKYLKVENTDLAVFCRGGVLHILDRNVPGTKTLTNAINDQFVEKVKTALSRKWVEGIYLYHTDGIVTQWKHENFYYISADHPELYVPFKLVCKHRRRKQLQLA